jgi:hypothetical protein
LVTLGLSIAHSETGWLEAATPLHEVNVSPDITAVFGGVTFVDHDVFTDDLIGPVMGVSVGSLPEAADIVGYHRFAGGDQLFSLQTRADLGAGVVAQPGDVVRYDGSTYSLEFDASAQGVPAGVGVDALSMVGGDLVLSFDVTLDLGGTIVEDEDLVRFDGFSFSLYFDGSAAGVEAGLDLDAVHLLGKARLLLSFDTTGSISGIDFDDEDLLEHNLSAGTWELSYDGSKHHAGWRAADLDAVQAVIGPEVDAVLPRDNALNVQVGTNVTLIFSEALDPLTVTTATIRLLSPSSGTPVPASVALAPTGVTVTLDPDPPGGSLEFGTIHTVVVTNGVQNLAGIPAVPFSSRFETELAPAPATPLPSVSNQTTLPPSPSPSRGLLPSSVTVGANLGFSAAEAGDLNDDTLADFLGGAPGYTVSGLVEAGVAIVAFGSTVQAEREEPDILFTGEAANDRAGVAVAGNFDFDGDGIEDILIGAEQVDRTQVTPEELGPGKVYLIYFDPNEYDFNGSGVPDYEAGTCSGDPSVVCRGDADCSAGTCSEPGPPLFVSLAEVGVSISGVVLSGVATGDQAGFSLAAGGQLESTDTRDDIVIGSPGASGFDGQDDGKVYVVFSDPSLTGAHDLGEVSTVIPGVVYEGASGERLGSAVALPGDVRDPAGDDIAMGAPLAEATQTGKVYVAAGGSLTSGTLSAAAITTQIHGDQPSEQLGFAVSGGGDNRAAGDPALPGGDPDLLIGAPFYDAAMGAKMNAGRVVQTSGRLPTEMIDVARVGDPTHLSPIDGVIWEGSQVDDNLGWAVGRLGDVTGNMLGDVGLGAPFADAGFSQAGAIYLIEGTANAGLSGTVNVNQVGQVTAGTIFIGVQADENAGVVMAAAGDMDLDADRSNDFTVGAPGWDLRDGTIHQVLDTNLPPPGRCGPSGCTVADLATGAQLVVSPGALAVTLDFAVRGLVDATQHQPSCAPTDLPGKTMVGVADFNDENFGEFGSSPPTIDIPTRAELEYQLSNGEALDLYFCDPSLLWVQENLGDTGQVEDNLFILNRKAVVAGVGTLHMYATFFDDGDGDEARTMCDCDDSPTGADLWAPPGEVDTLMLEHDTPTGTTALQWSEPEFPGGVSGTVRYDVIRSQDPSDFVAGGSCLEFDEFDSTATDSDLPLVGEISYYIIRAKNACPSDPMCRETTLPRPALDCTL